MFEFSNITQNKKLEDFLDVLSAKPKAHFYNDWHSIIATTEGYRGLATTALKAGHPVRLWDCESGVGLLFDVADEKNTKPIHVSSADANTSVRQKNFFSEKRILKIGDRPERREFAAIAAIQGENLNHNKRSDKEGCINLSDKKETQARTVASRLALQVFWEQLDTMDWKYYIKGHGHNMPGLNEVNAIVHMRGIKGLVIAKVTQEDSNNKPTYLIRRISEAAAVRKRLLADYTEFVPADLPVLIYDPKAKKQFHELTPEELENPESYFKRNPNLPDQKPHINR